MPETSIGLIVLVALLLVNGVLAAARSALVGASRPRLRQMVENGQGGAALALRVAEDATPLIATVRFLQTLARFFVAGIIALLYEPLLARWLGTSLPLAEAAGPLSLFLLMLLAALLVVGVGELLPEAWVMRAPERWAIVFAPLIAVLEFVLNPIVRLVLYLAARVSTPLAGRQMGLVTEEEIKTMVDAGEEGGAIEEEEKEMIYSIFEIGETMAREIMVPRTDMLALEASTPVAEAVSATLTAGHSRIPVYNGTVDNIVGLLYAKDLLRAWQEGGQPANLRDLLRPAFFVPETKKADELLAELQQQRIHLAVVVDEYGGTAGIVTLEDIVEEIVGEIRDEYDVNEESLFERVGDLEYIFDARIDLDEVNELLSVTLAGGDSDSLGGFIYGQLGHVPAPGEKVPADPVEFTVLNVTGRRIRKVRAVRQPEAVPQPASEGRRTNGNGNGHSASHGNGHAAPAAPEDNDGE